MKRTLTVIFTLLLVASVVLLAWTLGWALETKDVFLLLPALVYALAAVWSGMCLRELRKE